MNWDRVQGGWKQFKGSFLVGCGRMLDDPGREAAGRREMLAGKLQHAYGVGRDEADRQVHDWQKSIQEAGDEHDGASRHADGPR